MMSKSHITITERAALARVNRKLRSRDADGQTMKKVPVHSKWFNQYGPYMVVDNFRNAVDHYGCDLQDWARDLGCLKEYETIEGYK